MGTQLVPSPPFPVSSAQAEREEKVEKPQEASPEQAEAEKIRKQWIERNLLKHKNNGKIFFFM